MLWTVRASVEEVGRLPSSPAPCRAGSSVQIGLGTVSPRKIEH